MNDTNYELADHRQWIKFLVPEGLVVSARALIDAQLVLDRDRLAELQRRLREVTGFDPDEIAGETSTTTVRDLPSFFAEFLRWPLDRLVGYDAKERRADPSSIPPDLIALLADLGAELKPTYALRDPEPEKEASPWQLLIDVLPPETDLDKAETIYADWKVSPCRRFERHLREVGVIAGLQTNGRTFRLLSVPRGETAGWMDFQLDDMLKTTAGRPMVGGFDLLLNARRFFTGGPAERLPGLLTSSRRYQAEVSTRLAEQVLEALYELVRGFDAADRRQKGELLGALVERDPDHIYGGLLSVLMRLVFLLYAEDRGLLPESQIWRDHYSVHGLFLRLREDAGRFPDTMDSRFGAWASIVTLFRLVHGGSDAAPIRLPARKGHLFDPDRYPFLEGRTAPTGTLPLISDGVVWRILEKLLLLDGERLSYRTLDVEQIGSVYETMMGFRVVRIAGPAAAIRAVKRGGAPVALDLQELVAMPSKDRAKHVKKRTERAITGRAATALKEATTPIEAFAALDAAVARAATPRPTPPGALLLQPSDARRRSGSHYTPRSLTEPIVRKALLPQIERLGTDPTPEKILSLRVLDPAMGSGAFLVEACRQLAEELVRAWRRTKSTPKLPSDEDELLAAKREVARRCLYGVDVNPMAVDLAKLSLWLVTLARDHAFTFIDHALRHGDALVGLDRDQLEAFHWDPAEGDAEPLFTNILRNRLADIAAMRDRIRLAGDDRSESDLRSELKRIDDFVDDLRLTADQVIAAWFAGDSDAAKRRNRNQFVADATSINRSDAKAMERLRANAGKLRAQERPVYPFHWPIEFPEVFLRENPGFDSIVGNPPFAGKNTLAASTHKHFPKWLKLLHPQSHGNADLVAHFFRRAYNLVQADGTCGLIATKTIAQGDTRSTGLRWICTHGGTIYSARRRMEWEGAAAVVVAVVHFVKGTWSGQRFLDGDVVDRITAFLLTQGGDEDPPKLAANRRKAFQGSIVLGMGFTFDDTDKKGEANPIAEMERLIRKDPRNQERIFPYMGGKELNKHPKLQHHRFVINFGQMSEVEARGWPDLFDIVERKVRPDRLAKADLQAREYWWQFLRTRPELCNAIRALDRVLVIARVGHHASFAFLPVGMVYSDQLIVFATESDATFAVLQSRVHEVWVRRFSSTMKNDLRYTPSSCFETFPLPDGFEESRELRTIGRSYYDQRAKLMAKRKQGEGLTKVYNRFHDRDEETDSDVLRLRDLHAEMDRAVLDAYRWHDISTVCLFNEESEIGGEEAEASTKSKCRYGWPHETADKVLMRLLALSAERHEIEVLAGIAPTEAIDDEDEEVEDDEGEDEDADE